MVFAVEQTHFHVGHAIAGDDPSGHAGAHPFFDGWDELAGDGAAHNGVLELEAASAGQRRDIDVAHPELTAAAGLLLVLAFDVLGCAFDGFEVRNLGRQQVHLDAHAVQAIDGGLDVQLPGATEQDRLGLRVVDDLDGHVRVDDLIQLDRNLVLVALGLGLQRIGDERRGNDRPGQGEGRPFVGQRIARLGGLQLGHGDDIACEGLGDLVARLALQNVELPQALFGIVVDRNQRSIARQLSRKHPHDGQAADVRGAGLPHVGGHGCRGIGGALGGLVAHLALPGRPVSRRGEAFDDEIEKGLDAKAQAGRGGQHRHDGLAPHTRDQTSARFFVGQGAGFQILFHQGIVGRGDGFQEDLARLLGRVDHVGWNFALFDFAALARKAERLHGEQIHHAREVGLLANGELQRHGLVGKRLAHVIERPLEIGALAVQLGDEHAAGQPELVAHGPRPLGVDLHAVRGGHHHHGRIRDIERDARVDQEVPIARRVKDVDLVLLPLHVAGGGKDAGLAFLLLGLEVEVRRVVVHTAQPLGRLGREKDCLAQRGFAGAAMADQCNVSNLVRRVTLHALPLQMNRDRPTDLTEVWRL